MPAYCIVNLVQLHVRRNFKKLVRLFFGPVGFTSVANDMKSRLHNQSLPHHHRTSDRPSKIEWLRCFGPIRSWVSDPSLISRLPEGSDLRRLTPSGSDIWCVSPRVPSPLGVPCSSGRITCAQRAAVYQTCGSASRGDVLRDRAGAASVAPSLESLKPVSRVPCAGGQSCRHCSSRPASLVYATSQDRRGKLQNALSRTHSLR